MWDSGILWGCFYGFKWVPQKPPTKTLAVALLCFWGVFGGVPKNRCTQRGFFGGILGVFGRVFWGIPAESLKKIGVRKGLFLGFWGVSEDPPKMVTKIRGVAMSGFDRNPGNPPSKGRVFGVSGVLDLQNRPKPRPARPLDDFGVLNNLCRALFMGQKRAF